MAHLGGQWRQGVATIEHCPNVWSDISGSRAYLGSVEYAVRHLGAQRVLYGSDAFIRSFSVMLAKVAAADIAEAEKRLIVWENSQALFFDRRSGQ
jgi:predicted TIM-barrel fold metal-dependent hydrolase